MAAPEGDEGTFYLESKLLIKRLISNNKINLVMIHKMSVKVIGQENNFLCCQSFLQISKCNV